TIVETLSWVRKNHTFKFGGEYRIDTFNNLANNGATGTYNFAPAQTGQPSTEGQNLGGATIGHSYASFLLGLTNNASINNPTSVGFRRSSWAAFVHDSWKVTPKLTLELGLRYDVQNALHDLHYGTSMSAPDLPNPAAGNLPGATLFAGEGPGRCNCDLTKTYPWAFGPRFGFAYAFNPKTVIRGGWGITYGALGGFNYIGAGNSLGFGFNTIPFSNPAFGESAFRFRDGLVYNPADLYAQNINAG